MLIFSPDDMSGNAQLLPKLLKAFCPALLKPPLFQRKMQAFAFAFLQMTAVLPDI